MRTAGTTYLIYRGRHEHQVSQGHGADASGRDARAPAGDGPPGALLRRRLRQPRDRLPLGARACRACATSTPAASATTSSSTTSSTSCCCRCPTTTRTRTGTARTRRSRRSRRPTASSSACRTRRAASTRSWTSTRWSSWPTTRTRAIEQRIELQAAFADFHVLAPRRAARGGGDRAVPRAARGHGLRAPARGPRRAGAARGARRWRSKASSSCLARRPPREGVIAAAAGELRFAPGGDRARRPRRRLVGRGRPRRRSTARVATASCHPRGLPRRARARLGGADLPDLGRRASCPRARATSSPTGAASTTSAAAATARCTAATRSARCLLRRRAAPRTTTRAWSIADVAPHDPRALRRLSARDNVRRRGGAASARPDLRRWQRRPRRRSPTRIARPDPRSAARLRASPRPRSADDLVEPPAAASRRRAPDGYSDDTGPPTRAGPARSPPAGRRRQRRDGRRAPSARYGCANGSYRQRESERPPLAGLLLRREKPPKEIAQVTHRRPDGRGDSRQWTGFQVAWTMARGYPGAFGRKVNSPWVWLPLYPALRGAVRRRSRRPLSDAATSTCSCSGASASRWRSSTTRRSA